MKVQLLRSNLSAEAVLEQIKNENEVEIAQQVEKLSQMYEKHAAEKV